MLLRNATDVGSGGGDGTGVVQCDSVLPILRIHPAERREIDAFLGVCPKHLALSWPLGRPGGVGVAFQLGPFSDPLQVSAVLRSIEERVGGGGEDRKDRVDSWLQAFCWFLLWL